jgi:hypothetical protein
LGADHFGEVGDHGCVEPVGLTNCPVARPKTRNSAGFTTASRSAAATTASTPPDQRLKTEVIIGALLLEIKVADDATNLR